jgi:serine protease Do
LETEKKSSPWKRFLSTVGAGVIGSMLTLGVVFNTNLLPATTQNATEVQSNTTPSYNIEQTSAKNAPLSLSDMVEQASSAIVGVVKYQSSGNRFAQKVEDVESGTGSGVIYKVDGNDAYIVTNNHVIADAQKIEVSLESGEKTTAELIGQDALSDLAVLKIDSK